MASEIAADCPPFLRIYKDGRIERLIGTTIVPPSLDPKNGVISKDVVYSSENNLSVRLFLPHKATETAGRKLPLLVYFHGGGFLIETAFSPSYHDFLTEVVSAANCVAVSVDYRRAPEHLIPSAYEDSWTALKWVFEHFSGSGPADWLNKHADFQNVFLAGDSAGANISHHMAMRAGEEKLSPEGNWGISGIILIHPYFWGKTPVDELDTTDEVLRSQIAGIWAMASPNSADGVDDPWINVVGSGSDLSRLGCSRVLVMIAGKDALVRQGWAYRAKLEKSGWKGAVEAVEAKDEGHVFHLLNPNSEAAKNLTKKFAGFING